MLHKPRPRALHTEYGKTNRKLPKTPHHSGQKDSTFGMLPGEGTSTRRWNETRTYGDPRLMGRSWWNRPVGNEDERQWMEASMIRKSEVTTRHQARRGRETTC